MKVTRFGLCLWILLSASHCGQTYSLGEQRCAGPQTQCAQRTAVQATPQIRDLTARSERQADVLWWHSIEPPECSTVRCFYSEEQMVVHRDGSITAALPRLVERSAGAADADLWLVHVQPDGALSWQKRARHREGGARYAAPYTVALALDENDRALLAIDDAWDTDTFTIYELDATGELSELFALDDAFEIRLSRLAAAHGDLFVLREAPSHAHSEIARYSRTGELKWRQSALLGRVEEPADRSTGVSPVSTTEMGLAIDAQQRVWSLSGEDPPQLSMTDGSGHLGWNSWLSISLEAQQSPVMRLVLDSRGRPIVTSDVFGHLVMRFEPESPEKERAPAVSWWRQQDQYYVPWTLGLAVGRDDRIYILSQTGDRDARQLLLERIDADFTGLDLHTITEPKLQAESVRFSSLLLGPDDDVYVQGHDDQLGAHVGRLHLP